MYNCKAAGSISFPSITALIASWPDAIYPGPGFQATNICIFVPIAKIFLLCAKCSSMTFFSFMGSQISCIRSLLMLYLNKTMNYYARNVLRRHFIYDTAFKCYPTMCVPGLPWLKNHFLLMLQEKLFCNSSLFFAITPCTNNERTFIEPMKNNKKVQ